MQVLEGFRSTDDSNVIVRDFVPSAEHGLVPKEVAEYATAVNTALELQDDGSYLADLKLSGKVRILPNGAGVRIVVESLNGALGNNVVKLVNAVIGELDELA